MEKYIASVARYDNGDMLYRRCGGSGILLPKVSLGFWQNFGADASYDNCRSIARMAFDNGITHFDLANNYGPPPGFAEEMVGRMLKEDFASHRDELLIATKAGYDMWAGPYGSWGSRKHLMASLNQSLRRLGLDYVDIFYIHRFDPVTPLDETLQALVDIVRAGKAFYIGISRWPLEALKYADTFLRSQGVPPLIFQGRLNLLDRAVQQEGILDYCNGNGLGFISFSPLAQGLLSARYLNGIPEGSRMSRGGSLKAEILTPELLEYLNQLNNIATERGESLTTMALSWILSQRGVTSLIVGARTPEQFMESLKCVDSAVLTAVDLPLYPHKVF
ncbi:MAG: aldo/keto reductase [Bacteroidaceae bacterium]|nr:aldo/keto reductase [Bacteroidaceae bacterium]